MRWMRNDEFCLSGWGWVRMLALIKERLWRVRRWCTHTPAAPQDQWISQAALMVFWVRLGDWRGQGGAAHTTPCSPGSVDQSGCFDGVLSCQDEWDWETGEGREVLHTLPHRPLPMISQVLFVTRMSKTGGLERAGRCCTHISLAPQDQSGCFGWVWVDRMSETGGLERTGRCCTHPPAPQDQWISQVVLMMFWVRLWDWRGQGGAAHTPP